MEVGFSVTGPCGHLVLRSSPTWIRRGYDSVGLKLQMRNRSSDCRRPAIILALAFLGLVFSKQTIFAQADITLRFLDAASGKPIKGISVSVDAWDENRGQQKPQPQGTIKIARN